MKSRWKAKNGYRDVLTIGLPLAASMASATITQVTDRVFLGKYSLEALGASLSASVTNFVLIAFFGGLASYVNVFIAQYVGAKRPDEVGTSLWQGIWFALFSSVMIAAFSLLGPALFTASGHSPEIQVLEIPYFQILCLGSGFNVMAMTLSQFFTGRGITRPVLLVNIFGVFINIPLDYLMIFGPGPFPELGIRGAGIATIISWAVAAAMFALMIFTERNEALYKVRSNWRLQWKRFKALLYFGLPSGVEFFLDVFGFAVFIFLIGRLGNAELAATNMAFTLNQFSYMPMVGMHIATQIMMGQAIGGKKPDEGAEAAKSALHICLCWGCLMSTLFILFPGIFTEMFRPNGYTDAQFANVHEMGRILLLYVAGYTMLDAFSIIFIGALKGAGDTRFVMRLIGFSSMCVLVLPVYFVLEVFHLGLYSAWFLVDFYVFTLVTFSYLRYKKGAWRSMSVIRDA